MVVDGVWVTIGTTNVDNRSFALNQEINLTVYDRGVGRRMEQIFDEDLKYAAPVSYDEWKTRGIVQRVIEWFSFPLKEQL